MLDAIVSWGKASWYEDLSYNVFRDSRMSNNDYQISNVNVLSFKLFPNCTFFYFSDVITFPGKVEEAVSLFEEWRIAVPPNTIIISNLIKGRIRFVITKRPAVSVCANWFKYFFLEFVSKIFRVKTSSTESQRLCGTRRCRACHGQRAESRRVERGRNWWPAPFGFHDGPSWHGFILSEIWFRI